MTKRHKWIHACHTRATHAQSGDAIAPTRTRNKPCCAQQTSAPKPLAMRSNKVAQGARRAAATRALATSLLALLLAGVATGAALMPGRVALLIAAVALAPAAALSAACQVRGGAYRLLRRPLRNHQSRPLAVCRGRGLRLRRCVAARCL